MENEEWVPPPRPIRGPQKLPRGVRGGAPAEVEFSEIRVPKKPSGGVVACISLSLNRSIRHKHVLKSSPLTSVKLKKVPRYNFQSFRHELSVGNSFYVLTILGGRRHPYQDYTGVGRGRSDGKEGLEDW